MKSLLERPKFLLYLLLFLFIGNPAHAYLGPGAGLGMIGSLIALVIVVLVILFGLILYPIRRFIKRRRGPDRSDEPSDKESNP